MTTTPATQSSRVWRFTPALARATAILVVCAGALLLLVSERAYREQKINEALVQAQILASTVAAALTFDDRDAAQEYIIATRINPELRAAAIYDAHGAPFANYLAEGALPLPPSAPPLGTSFAEDRLTVTVPVTEGDTRLGTAYVRWTTEPFSRRLERYGVIGLLIILGAMIFLVLGAAQAALGRANAELVARATELADANARLEAQIAERERAEAALWQAQKMEAIGQLTGGVAHDFNNLLHVVLGNLSAAELRLQRIQHAGITEVTRLVSAAVRGGERAASLTQRLLAFARRQPLAPTPIDLNKLVGAMSDLLHRTLGEKIEIETVLAAGVWRTLADANQLESALLNLAVNSRDAMPNGGKLTVETGNAYLDEAYAAASDDVRPGQYAVIAVTDTGTGMSKEVLQKAFEPFFTTKDVGQGTGLGLSQVYGFVKQSGGHIKIYSEPGDGTTVKIYLPRLMAAAAPAEDARPQEAFPTGDTRELILIVEDDADVRTLTAETLRQLGYSVLTAADGPAALALLDKAPSVQLLFTDIGLPGPMNGRQLSDAARRRRPALKVLFTTGYARNAIVHHGRLDPEVQLITKPFSYSDLARKIRAVLEG
jgi:signal transduction histidine kinase/CheY-like chemotaxis protein